MGMGASWVRRRERIPGIRGNWISRQYARCGIAWVDMISGLVLLCGSCTDGVLGEGTTSSVFLVEVGLRCTRVSGNGSSGTSVMCVLETDFCVAERWSLG